MTCGPFTIDGFVISASILLVGGIVFACGAWVGERKARRAKE